jgi:hypothetical protein
MLVTISDVKSYCNADNQTITIYENNKNLYFKRSSGASTLCELTADTYTPGGLAAHVQAVLRAEFEVDSLHCSWNDTTNKFTISADGDDETIQYIHSNSTAGYSIGFTEDSEASNSISSNIEIVDRTATLTIIYNAVDKFVKNFTKRNIEAADYTGLYRIYSFMVTLDDFPVNSVSVVSDDLFNPIRLYNADDYIGVKYASQTLTFSDGNTIDVSALSTLSDLVTAINSVGNGTTASILSSEYSSLSVSRMLDFPPHKLNNCDIPCYGEIASNYTLLENQGIMKFGKSSGEVYIEYNAGYSTIPYDLKDCVLQITRHLYNRWLENTNGLSSYKLDDEYTVYRTIPNVAKLFLNSYRKIKC